MLSKSEMRRLEIQSKDMPEIALILFVRRGPLIVLQTTGDDFEMLDKNNKLAAIDGMEKGLAALKEMVEKD